VKRKKMNTKIIVALVVGIALIGLTGTASAAYYNINGSYVYADGAANDFSVYTGFEVDMYGTGVGGDPIHMHNWVDNYMDVITTASDDTDVFYGLEQSGASTLTIVTDLPGNLNTFTSQDIARQEIAYVAYGDAFDIDFYGDSCTHASTHYGILPLGSMAVWDENVVLAGANVGTAVCEGEPCGYDIIDWDPESEELPKASIKYGTIGYECTTFGDALMEAEHVLEPVDAGSGIIAWSNAAGEIWEPYGAISTDVDAEQDVWMYWDVLPPILP
jgi:hypothetical protein